ncbi:transcription factor grauzone-like isoform X4 [Lucilia cuprina]|uniref:transcription factor grauzone-like isoform X4 n=1 Tax=Lucilia cuprina TaxID=7375 RepID=UPI001F05B39B|nr:transcription factor grauzone-like isoform X4 [Lucilia cuprina]
MVVKCLLCLEYPTIPGPKFLEIFGEEGLRLDISAIINKYFWLKTNRNSEDVQKICMTCWEVVRDFHILYQRVEEVHKHIAVKTIVLDDPLPQDVMLKSEDDPSMAQDPIMDDNGMGDSIFDPEVKVEVHDLDLLPQIEILETANVSDRSARSSRRGRPARDQSPKVSTKRIKKEQSPAADATDVFASNENLNKDGLNESSSLEDLNYTNSLDKSDKEDSSNKRRGRPRKTDTEKAKATTPRSKRSKKQQQQSSDTAIKSEQDAEDQPSCSTAQQTGNADSAEPKIKTENPTDEQNYDNFAIAAENFEDDDAYAQDDYDDDNDNNYAKDSEESSHSELESDASNDSDWGESQNKKKEKFAVIMKKERNVPKKYKKREKPLVEPKRMSREEIEARQAQQAEYDSIITKFFEKIRCPKCELLVHTFGEMRAHFRLDHNDDHGFVECCGRRFATRKFLAEHILVHYNPEHFKCKTCDKVCRDSTQLESHEQTHLPNPPASKYKKTFQCEKCSKTFSSKASFEHHMVAKHVPREEFKFECPECKKKYPSKRRLNEHRHHHNPAQAYVCDQCGKTVYTLNTLHKHKKVVHGVKPPKIQLQCEFCKRFYTGKQNLQHHIRNMHNTNEDKRNVCELCGFVSTTREGKMKHIRFKHRAEKKFQCAVCERSFKVPALLKEHMATHTGVDLYKCSYCPNTFKSKSNMYNHCKRLHAAEFENRTTKRMRIPKIVPNLAVVESVEFELLN